MGPQEHLKRASRARRAQQPARGFHRGGSFFLLVPTCDASARGAAAGAGAPSGAYGRAPGGLAMAIIRASGPPRSSRARGTHAAAREGRPRRHEVTCVHRWRTAGYKQRRLQQLRSSSALHRRGGIANRAYIYSRRRESSEVSRTITTQQQQATAVRQNSRAPHTRRPNCL